MQAQELSDAEAVEAVVDSLVEADADARAREAAAHKALERAMAEVAARATDLGLDIAEVNGELPSSPSSLS